MSWQKNPNLVLISLDCVRPDSLSCYNPAAGKPGPTSPQIDRLAAEGVRFTQAISQAPYTPASHASLFTGLYPPRHGIRAMMDYRMAAGVTTLAEVARAHGYQTAAFVGADAMSRDYGLQRGFDVYDDRFEQRVANWKLGYRRFGDEVTGQAIDWLQAAAAERPFLLFLHYFDAHSVPIDVAADLDSSSLGQLLARLHRGARSAPRPYRRLVGALYRRYFRSRRCGRKYQLRQVREIDHYLGQLFDHLRAAGRYDDTVVVITADHGDAFGEHGETGHRHFLYDTTLRVPLILRARPQFAGRVFPHLARLVDVMPTLCDLADIPLDPALDLDGVSLLPALSGETPPDLNAYSETRHERSFEEQEHLIRHFNSLRSEKWKLIWDRLDDSQQLYDLQADPGELQDVASQHPDVVAALQAELQAVLDRAVAPERISEALDESDRTQVEERLRALGYL
ncbi:MAG: sulfatase [Anaerolineae bacterium]|nr:sulfatase [Anaerolineae bacterium]